MEYQKSVIDPLIERAKEYAEIQLELIKLNSIHKTADLVSLLLAKLITGILVTLFLITFTVGVALWIGDCLGTVYYGFLLVAGFYGFIALFIILFRSGIKRYYFNSIVSKLTSIVWKK